MTFNSLQYAVFLPVVLAVYWQASMRTQNAVLLLASYVFYGAWDVRFLSLLLLSTTVDYVVGVQLGSTDDERRRKTLLISSLVVNLGALASFKYFDFFVESASGLLEALGLPAMRSGLEIVLPVGISFYTFQTMSYTIDVYRRKLEPNRDPLTFALFVAYFPQLVAGPIERATNLLPQLARPRVRPGPEETRSALMLILLGLAKKVAIADAVAPYVNDIFQRADSASSLELLVGVYLFALQIYGDFSGYSDIARGSSRLLGIELMVNFSQPYLSRSITAFWRNWHISLSSWLRDYLYIPLGGNRHGPRRTAINLGLVMVLGGLWHGAAWTFVAWGAIHGMYLAVDRRRAARDPRAPDGPVRASDAVAIFATFNLVCLAWAFFRASSIGEAVDYLAGILALRGGLPDSNAVAMLIVAGAAVVTLDLLQRASRSHTPMVAWPPLPAGVLVGACVVAVILFSGAAPVPFIYFQF